MVDSFPVLFQRALGQHLHNAALVNYKTSGTYTAADATLTKPGLTFGPDLPTTFDNVVMLTTLEPIRDGRADLIHRIQVTSRLKGTKVQAQNLAWALFTALDQQENVPAGFHISWATMFSQLGPTTPDSSGRFLIYQNFHFRGRRP